MAFAGFQEAAGDFFIRVKLNNTTEYFNEHRAEFDTLIKKPMQELAEALIPTVEGIDSSLETRPVKVVSRIRRDTRFSRDKSLYRDHMWIGWRPMAAVEERSTLPGMYFSLNIDTWDVGCGYYAATPATMRAFRGKILASPSAFLSIIEDPALTKRFTLCGEDYKKPKIPPELPEPIHPWFSKKNFYVDHSQPLDDISRGEGLAAYVAEYLSALGPLYRYLKDLPIKENG